jgi:5'-nucleotidase
MEESKFQNRRHFLRSMALGATGVLLMPNELLANAFPSKKKIKLTILHTNDMHSHIDPFPANDPKYAGMGGMERRAAMIERIRKEEELVLLLDSGDVFQGTPYFNYFGGEPEFKLMSLMGYDVCTMGNHDFDNGLEGILKVLPHAKFPFVCANYDFSETILKDKTLPHVVIRKGPLKIGVFGLGVELEGLVAKKNYGKTRYLDPISIANQQAAMLRHEMGCDLVVCLSHLGHSYTNEKISDMKLAAQTTNIDVILGGHTHTFMDKAELLSNKDGKVVVMNQAAWGGLRLGRIDIAFECMRKNGEEVSSFSYIVRENEKIC